MERQFQCPSCGAANTVTNPGTLMRVCDYCRTALYWDKESALRAGNKSVDLPRSTRFRVGGTGKIQGNAFRVLGRLSYAHENGTWDEWFIAMDDGRVLWLTEDEGELFLEEPIDLESEVPPFSELKPGKVIPLNDKFVRVEELGQARCLGGEGEIPFVVEVGEVYPYADGAMPDGKSSFGLEYDPRTGEVHAFVGRILGVKDGQTRREDRAAPAARTGEAIRCSSCGKPYEGPRVQTTRMVVCDACGSGLELDEAETRVVGHNVGDAPPFAFPVGQPITVSGVRFEVMGRLFYVEEEEGITYGSFDYALYNPDAGYLWLSQEDGHFTVKTVIHTQIRLPPIPVARMKVSVGGTVFQIYESGVVTLRWVDGALPWRAAVGETTQYTHLVNPPGFVDHETTGQEEELFQGRYFSREELQAGLPAGVTLPSPGRSVYSCQPYEPSPWVRGWGKIGAVFLVLNVLLMIWSLLADKSSEVLKERISAEQYAKEYLTAPFTVYRDGIILCLKGRATLKNSWIAMDFALVNAQDQVISEVYGDASFYSGTDSEGSWSEGSPSFRSCFRVDKAGTYRLLIHGQGGTGETGPAGNEPVDIVVVSGTTISWYFIVPMVICLVVAVVGPACRAAFEARRWSKASGGSDDDDD